MKKNLLLTLALCLILLMTFCTAASAEDTYKLTVNGGTGSGFYAEDAQVSISPDEPPAGQVFVRWDTEYKYLYGVNLYEENLSFKMPDDYFTLTAVFADPHTHAPCGNATCTDATHPAHTTHNYLPLEDINDLRLNAGDNYYHLSQDITLTYNVSAPSYISIGSGKTLYLCLHGYDITSTAYYSQVFSVTGTGKLVICDCKGADISTWGKIMHSTGSKSSDVGIMMNGSIDTADDPVLEMYGGNITGNNPNSSDSFRNNGAGVYADYGSAIAMYNGAITNNKTNQLGGGICLYNGSTFTMYGGTISGNTAYKGGGIYSDSVKTTVNAVAIHGGTITGNTASYGGGLYIGRDYSNSAQDLLITGGSITQNKASSYGGGVYLDYSQATMSAGTISGNELTYDYEDYGGGVYLYTSSRFNMNGGIIKENKADYGAGVYVTSSCNGFFVSGSATVTDNKTSNVYLDSWENQDKCIQVTGPLTGTIGVKTEHTPSATKPVRFLHPSNHILTKSDLDHIVSDVSGTYYVKNIDQENYGIFGYVQYKVAVSTVENGKVTASSSSAAEGKSIGLTIELDTGYELDTVKVYDADGKPVDVSADYKFTMPASDVTVEAEFQPMQYTIQFMNMDGTVLQTSDVPYGTMPSYDGETPTKAADAQYTYTFTGWSPEIVAVTGEATYTATFSNSTNSYTVTWQNEAGELIDAESVEYGGSVTKSPAVPDKLGHTGKWNHDGKNIVQNTIIKPEYTANQYTLTFNTDGGSVIAPITQKYGSAVTAPAAPVKEGWIFQGWDKVLPATMPAENMAFTAKWAPRTTLASFSLSAAEIWLHSTQTHQLEVTGLDPSGALCEFTWTSSDTAVMAVDSTGLLTASAPGTAVLTVKEKWSGLSKTCTVHVASPVTAITFAETALQMAPGDTRTLTATVTCSDQTVTNKLVTFSSSDEKVATVDQNGIVTAVSEGSVTITATAVNGVSASCTIKVLLLGDANDDGKVDVADVLIILQYSAGWDVTVNTVKADVTGDGTIGLSDALKILQDCMGGDIALPCAPCSGCLPI